MFVVLACWLACFAAGQSAGSCCLMRMHSHVRSLFVPSSIRSVFLSVFLGCFSSGFSSPSTIFSLKWSIIRCRVLRSIAWLRVLFPLRHRNLRPHLQPFRRASCLAWRMFLNQRLQPLLPLLFCLLWPRRSSCLTSLRQLWLRRSGILCRPSSQHFNPTLSRSTPPPPPCRFPPLADLPRVHYHRRHHWLNPEFLARR